MKGPITGIIFAILIGIGMLASSQLYETLDAGEIMVIQDPIDGELHVFTEPGMYAQWCGHVMKYPRRSTYEFGSNSSEAPAKKLRFNDGGHADLSGAVSWEMPLDAESIIHIHRTFNNPEGIQQAAIAKMIDSAVYLSGPLMSSTESSGERRAELVQYINDQAESGVYVTRVVETKVVDPITGQDKSTLKTEVVLDANGMPKRQQGSILKEFNIKLMPMSITSLTYDNIVEDQIKKRQDAITQVQIAQANARRAEQDAITAEKVGQAEAAKAKWTQEVIKAQKVTEAEQQLQVQKLATQQAEAWKQEQILKGEGEAERKKLAMVANGALEQKLEAWVQVNAEYAKAIAQYKGNWVPGVVMAGNGSTATQTNGAQQLIDMLSVKTAKDLSLDLSVQK